MTCAKTQGFLAKHKVTVTEQADAKKATIKGAAALGVLDGVDELYVAKGKKVEHVDLSARPSPTAPRCWRSCWAPPATSARPPFEKAAR